MGLPWRIQVCIISIIFLEFHIDYDSTNLGQFENPSRKFWTTSVSGFTRILPSIPLEKWRNLSQHESDTKGKQFSQLVTECSLNLLVEYSSLKCPLPKAI